jgi:hypothetical protein
LVSIDSAGTATGTSRLATLDDLPAGGESGGTGLTEDQEAVLDKMEVDNNKLKITGDTGIYNGNYSIEALPVGILFGSNKYTISIVGSNPPQLVSLNPLTGLASASSRLATIDDIPLGDGSGLSANQAAILAGMNFDTDDDLYSTMTIYGDLHSNNFTTSAIFASLITINVPQQRELNGAQYQILATSDYTLNSVDKDNFILKYACDDQQLYLQMLKVSRDRRTNTSTTEIAGNVLITGNLTVSGTGITMPVLTDGTTIEGTGITGSPIKLKSSVLANKLYKQQRSRQQSRVIRIYQVVSPGKLL